MHRILAFVLSLVAMATVAAAQDFPARAIKIVVPFAPGGGTDILARIIGERLHEKWGQAVVIENQPGASGGIGARAVLRAEPDGHTLLMASTGALMAAASAFGDTANFDVNQHLAPVALAAAPPYLVVVVGKSPVASIADLIRLAREKPGSLTFGSSGVGAASHLAGELFQKDAALELLHVPYKGTGQAVTDLLGGRIDVMFAPPQTVQSLVDSGELKALATTGAKRSQLYPNLPTVAEEGVAGYEAIGWFGLLAPGKTPSAIVDKLNGEIVAFMATPQARERLAALGAEPQGQSPSEFGRFINDDVKKWTSLVREKGIVMPGSSQGGAR